MFGPASPIDAGRERSSSELAASLRDALRSPRARAFALLAAGALLIATLASPARHAPAVSRAHALARADAGLAILPLAAQDAVSRVVGADDPAYRVRTLADGSLLARNAGMRATFRREGVAVAFASTRLQLALRSLSFARGASESLAPVAPHARANEVDYAYPSLKAWYRNGPAGIEQGFVLERPVPDANRPSGFAGINLDLTFSLKSNARFASARDAQSVTFTRGGRPVLRLGALRVTDADGRTLASSFAVARGQLALRVHASRARYPITIDPILEQGSPLTGSGEVGPGRLGLSVAISEDGTTALVGAPHDNNFSGAAWVFVRDGGEWTQQGAKLVAGGVSEVAGCSEEPIFNSLEENECGFGTSVAISGDGNTALVGSPRDNGLRGSAWVFTRSGSSWSHEPLELSGVGEIGEGHFGRSVAISNDGTIALVSAPNDNKGHGAVWAFKRTEAGWTVMGEGKITPNDGVGTSYFGRGLAISPDGGTVLVGGPGDTSYAGAAWLFARAGSGWTQQERVTANDESGAGRFGFSAALSEGGETALIGGPRDNGDAGSAWLFTRSGATLTQEGPKLAGAGEIGENLFGRTVALSASGRVAIVGAPRDTNGYGAAFVFRRSLSGISSEKFSEASRGNFGAAVAISSDGNVPLFGEPVADGKAGIAWAGLPPADVTGLEPSSGPAAGGNTVEIAGAGFTGVTGVSFGEKSAPFEVRSSSLIVAVAPPGGPGGIVDVTVATTRGRSLVTAADRYTYLPPEGAVSESSGDEGPESSEEESGTLGWGSGASACRFVLVSKKVRVRSRGRATPRLRRVRGGRCRGKLTLTVRMRGKHGRFQARPIGSTRFTISGPKPVTVTVRLNALGRSLLRAGHGQVSASLVLVPNAAVAAHAQRASVRLRLAL